MQQNPPNENLDPRVSWSQELTRADALGADVADFGDSVVHPVDTGAFPYNP